MASIVVRKENENRPAVAPHAPVWEPARIMRALLGWDPFREMMPMEAEDRAFAFSPAFEVKETKEGFVFTADLPGIKESEVDVNLTGNRLTISGKREQEKRDKTETYYTYERSYGSFTRAFTLPEGIDAANTRAELKDGVLLVTIAKKPEAQPKKIPVQGPPAPPAAKA